MEPRYRAPRGTTDLVYPEAEKVERLLALAGEILALHGYQRISTPILESTDLFRRSIGEQTDIVTKEMYTFEDQGGGSLTLRPEGTAPVVRAYLERSLFSRGLPQKLYYFGPMFRRERPQAGRFRQFLQIGAEAIGSDDPFLDAEIISLSDILFRRLGLTRYLLVTNSVGCSRCRPKYVRALSAFLEGISGSLCEQCRRRASENPLRVFDCKDEGCREAVSGAPRIGGHLCGECRGHFDAVSGHLEGLLDVRFTVDDRLVRGLDYYTRTTFEFQFEGLGAQNAVSAGGRYDYLAEELGGPHTPGVGFSLGVERLLIAMEAEGLDPFTPSRLDIFITCAQGVPGDRVLALLNEMRKEGISADADFLGRSLKSQMKQADRLRARLVLIVGEEELERGEVAVRDLDESRQWAVSLDDVVRRVRESLEGE